MVIDVHAHALDGGLRILEFSRRLRVTLTEVSGVAVHSSLELIIDYHKLI
jgi:hypothetical protein